MTRDEILATHSEYENNIDDWMFYERSYLGGRHYKEAGYLLQHPFESAQNYARRQSISYYYNYCAPIVDIFVSHLFKKPIKRDFGSLNSDKLFENFLIDSDLDGSSFSQFMRNAQRYASIYGRVTIFIDKPSVAAATRAHAVEEDIRPYAKLILPQNILDWSYDSTDDGRIILSMIKIKEDFEHVRIVTTDGWELWNIGYAANSVGDDEVLPFLVSSGSHDLGVVPVVNLYNKRSNVPMVGVSDLQDIADINKNIYYLCSDAKEIIENTAFPMLAVPYGRNSSDEELEVGPRNILQFDPSESNSKPYWLEAPHSSLSEIRQWIRQDINEIFRIAKMGGVRAIEDSSSPQSGVALEIEYQQLHAALSEKADNLELTELKILTLWSMWEGKSFDGLIDYPNDFTVQSVEKDLSSALKVRELPVNSERFNKELQKKVVRLIMPKLSGDAREAIFKEIENFTGVN